MAFAASRNRHLDPRFHDIARQYRTHGERWRVRWDYAFFQMLVETNYLTFRKPGGRRGDVFPRQNNFAGLGATGGVPGDSFPTVSAGVLAQIQHLVVYSGERVEHPTAPRTRLKMDEILARSRQLDRRVTYHDLSGRWAADRAYGHTIETTAHAFRRTYCGGPTLSDSFPAWSRMSALWPRLGRSEASPENSPGTTRRDGDDARPAPRERVTRMPKRRAAQAAASPTSRAAKTEPASVSQANGAAPRIAVTSPSARAPAVATEDRQSASATSPGTTASTVKPPPASNSPPGQAPGLPRDAEAAKPDAPAPSAAAAAPSPAASPAPGPVQARAPAEAPAPTPPQGQAQAAEPRSAQVAAAAPPPDRPAPACKIFRASYGGPKTVLIQAQKEQATHFTVLGVTAGKEKDQAKAFIDAHARGGKVIGEFPLETEALKKSFELCPGG